MPETNNSEIEKQTGTFTSFDNTPIYYEVRGKGRPIVLAYGIGCLMNHWRHQVKYFSQDFKTILFDYRGHHKSGCPRTNENYSLEAISQDINGLMKHLGLRKASFWSHSFGSQVLLETYKNYPELFANLVMINGFATNPLKNMFGNDLALKTFRAFKGTYDVMPRTLRAAWKLSVNNPVAAHVSAFLGGFNLQLTSFHDIEVYARGVGSMDLDAFTSIFEHMLDYDGRPVVPTIDVPTLIVGGRNDAVTPIAHQKKLHQQIKNSEYLEVPYGSHCTQLDMPEFVNLRIEKFLRDQKFR